MKEIGVFDVIGPIMVGPSSSHTAGALRIAAMVNRMANSPIVKVEFTLYGSFAQTYQGHGTDRALLGGILGFDTSDLRVRDSFQLADQAGVAYTFIPDAETETEHPNTITIRALTRQGQKISVTGESTGGGAIRITRINDIKVSFTGEYYTIVIEQDDAPGVITTITSIISEFGINIAFMRVYRQQKGGRAFAILEADEPIDEAVTAKLLSCVYVKDVSIISI